MLIGHVSSELGVRSGGNSTPSLERTTNAAPIDVAVRRGFPQTVVCIAFPFRELASRLFRRQRRGR